MDAGFLQRAESLMDLDRPQEAAAVLERGLSTDPDDPVALAMLASARLELDQSGAALVAAERASATAPDLEWAHRLRSLALADLRRHDEAVHAAIEAIRVAPELWQPHVQYALTAVRFPALVGNALAAARRAVQLAPHQAGPHFAVGVTAERLRRHEESEAAYRRALAIDPTHAGARNNLTSGRGFSLGLREQLDGYAQALLHRPDLVVAQENIELVAYRFVRRFYWAALAGLLVCLFAALPDPAGFSVVRVVVGVVMLVGLAAWAVLLVRRVPVGIRAFVRERLVHEPFLLATGVLSLLMLLAACAAAFLPVPSWFVTGVVRPLGLANVALMVWGVARIRTDD